MSWRRLLLTATVLAAAGAARGAEVLVQAPVVNVEPITGHDSEVLDCPEKPQGSLGEMLTWDLGLSCTRRVIPSQQIEGYRVFYRWDDRVHERVMSRDPGETVALRLKVD